MTVSKLVGALVLASAFAAPSAVAGTAFGSDGEARAIAAEMSTIITEQGLDAGIEAMHDPALPFASSVMGIHVFEGSVIVADNREPELIASSYAEVQDLTEEPMWPRIVQAAHKRSNAELKWYHYDTEEIYDYDCYSEWAVEPDVLVMVCR